MDKGKLHFVNINLQDLNQWEEIVNSKSLDKISNVVVISQKEYNSVKDEKNTQKVDNKILDLKHIPSSLNDNIYKVIEYKVIENEQGNVSVFLKSELLGKYIDSKSKSINNYYSNLQYYSPLNANSACANNPFFMGIWGIFSILGFLVVGILIYGLLNGFSVNAFEEILPGCNNCIDNVIDKFKSDNTIEDQSNTEENEKIVNPFTNPLSYLKNSKLNQSEKLDVTLLWLSKNDLDLIAVDPNGQMLWKNNMITSFGIMDKAENDSQLNSLNKYSLDESLKKSDSVAIEHLYFPEGIKLNEGPYRIYVLNSDKRVNCGKSESFYLKVVHNNKTQYFNGKIENTINNRCVNETSFKQVYTSDKLEFYKENNAAELVFEINVN